ncbi:MAG: hypothetical protein ACFE8L_08770 [Candidatus Hodarchaeota archaeon]
MKEDTNGTLSETESLKEYVKNEIITNAKKVRGRHTPISEMVNNVSKILKIKDIYKFEGKLKNIYLFIANNYTKKPKNRYFLVISLASQSSDLLVSLAKEFAKRNNLKLIQYSIFPKTLRIHLLLIKELIEREDYSKSIQMLKSFRIVFQNRLANIRDLIENQ